MLKTDTFDLQSLPDSFWSAASSFLTSSEPNFVAQANLLGLDRSQDFRHADLAGVDFSHCDLSGFDFTGADLRGSFGLHVKWDATTVFSDADARGSLFAFAVEQARYFHAHPEDREIVERLTGETWTNTILGVEKLLRSDLGDGSSAKIASAIFDETESTVVRSNVLAFMRIATHSAQDHKAFIFNVFARFSDQPSIVMAGIRTLGAFYKDDADAFKWLNLFLEVGDANQRREAFKAIMTSKHFMRGLAGLREYVINSDDSLTRRLFLGRLAKAAGANYVRATADVEVSNFLDFAQPITRGKLERMALKALQVQRLRSRALATSRNVREVGMGASVEEDEVRELAEDFRRYLSALATQYKIPLMFQ